MLRVSCKLIVFSCLIFLEASGLAQSTSNSVWPVVRRAPSFQGASVEEGDQFGIAIAVSGDTIVVGANLEDSNARGVNGDAANNSSADSGAAYVFVRDGGNWVQQAYLKASNTDLTEYSGESFGWSVGISGDTMVVGAFLENSSATGVNGDQFNNDAVKSGAAYVFVRNGTNWVQQAYLKASNSEANDWFGHSVAISGDTIIVGARREESASNFVNGDEWNNDLPEAGAAYIFVREGTNWTQQAYLKPSNTDWMDEFGAVVDISGDLAIVSAYGDDSNAMGVNGNGSDNSAMDSGAAYIFVRENGVWTEQAYLKASNTGTNDYFGSDVAISGETAVVGAHNEDSSASGVNGNTGSNGLRDSGAAYVFARIDGRWVQQAYLKGSNPDRDDRFGSSVSIDGDSVVVGASYESGLFNGSTYSGAAYLFVRNGTIWKEDAYLKGGGSFSRFGTRLDVEGGTIAVSTATSRAYAFTGEPLSLSIGLRNERGPGYSLFFEARSGKTYRLQRSTTMPGGWEDIGVVEPDVLDPALYEHFDDTQPPGRAFYRLILQ